ncbi:MAG: ATP-dependent Clp protease ATP-binding subunit [Clostridia bacterium]|nr:ATP-dependent Clp protease ATP-binding subunit [Clostridia bacterium]
MYNGLKITRSTQLVLQEAEKSVVSSFGSQITTLHLLYGLSSVSSGVASTVLRAYGITPSRLWAYINNITVPSFSVGLVDLSQGATAIISTAGMVANELNAGCISTEHILYAIVSNRDCEASQVIEAEFGVSIEDIKEKLLTLFKDTLSEEESEPKQSVFATASSYENSHCNNYSTSNKYNANLPESLKDLGIDLTERARQGKIDEIIGRDNEIERAIEILCRKTKNNPILIGDAGVGKSAIAEGLALKVVKGEVPEMLKGKKIFSLELGSLMAGTKYRGSMEEKLKNAIEAITQDKSIIVFIDEIHTLVQASGEKGEISPADMLKPYLARGDMQTIGATTIDEYRKFIEKDKALERRFQPIMVEQPSIEDSIKILQGIRLAYENYHRVTITDEAISSAVNLSDRYITDRNLPDKAIDLIDEASSRARVKASENDRPEIREEDVAEVVAKWTGIPVNKIGETDIERLNHLEEILHKRVIGQNEAVQEVCKALRRSRIGIADSKRPIGSFLFLGQTGVGKTELCKALAEAMFDSEKSLIRIDMSEYMESHSVAKLIGAPPGYVGHDEGGQLTEQVRRKPYSVVLFDEIEKAHPDVLNMFLQLLDDGRLTDSKGRLVNFKNCIIIATSNIGANKINKPIDLGFKDNKELSETEAETYERDKQIMLDEMRRYLKPELINRFDNIVVFHKLNKMEMAQIATIIINNLNKRLKAQNLMLRLDDKALQIIVEKGSDANYGARPLKRFIQREIEDRLADELLNGRFVGGGEILVSGVNGYLEFTNQPTYY